MTGLGAYFSHKPLHASSPDGLGPARGRVDQAPIAPNPKAKMFPDPNRPLVQVLLMQRSAKTLKHRDPAVRIIGVGEMSCQRVVAFLR